MSGASLRTRLRCRTSSPADDFALSLWTSDVEIARTADRAGVDRIGVDLESLGKAERQRNRKTWISPHTPADLRAVGAVLERAQLFVRVNPLHHDSRLEVETVIAAGAQVIMLPMVADADEAARFVDLVNGRATVTLLVERKEAVDGIDALTAVDGVSEVHVGLNDLALSLALPNRWLVLAGDLIRTVAARVRHAGLRFGLGGIGRAGDDTLPIPSDLVYAEYARTGAASALLARSFYADIEPDRWASEIARSRARLAHWRACSPEALAAAHAELGVRAQRVASW